MLVLVDKDNKIVKYPYTIANLKEDNRNVTFPASIDDETLAYFNVYRVHGEIPKLDAYSKVDEGTPIYRNGAWHKNLKIRDATNEEIQIVFDIEANKVKSKRNDLLKECDWTVLPDADLTDAEIAEWKKYRQALRDISTSKGYPWNVTWPTPPNISSKVTLIRPEL